MKMKEIYCDVAIVGAGPAGLAAARSAKENGAENVVMVERDVKAGGILQQCIHAGFGLKYFGEELTGPEYAEKFENKARGCGVEIMLDTTALEAGNGVLVCANRCGITHIRYKALILAMGCRERTRANLVIPGSRPAGIYTAGTAQRLMNIYGRRVGKEIVILGSGDIGMIMARRLTLGGARVKAVVELMPFLAGLVRNKVQCLDDFDIPLKLSHTIVDITGKDRVESVKIAPVDENKKPIMEKAQVISCDTLLLSVGLIPENELSRAAGVPLSPVTKGAIVNQYKQTEIPSIFACGNVLHVNDLADNVSRESEEAGRCAALYALGSLPERKNVTVEPGVGVRYVCPQRLALDGEKDVALYFRTAAPGRDSLMRAESGGEIVSEKKAICTSPGTMEELTLKAAQIKGLKENITVSVIHGEELL